MFCFCNAVNVWSYGLKIRMTIIMLDVYDAHGHHTTHLDINCNINV